MAVAVYTGMRFVLPALLALVAGCVCGYDHNLDDAADSCPDPEDFQPATSELGRAYLLDIADGQPLPIAYGPQGGCMVTPTICVEAPWVGTQASRPDSTCMIVDIQNEVDAPGAFIDPGSAHMTELDASGDGVYCATVWNYLDDCERSHDGLRLRMQLEVRAEDGEVARGETAVVLQD